MPFFIDDLFLEMLGLSVPPFDMVWLMETIMDYADEGRVNENQQRINNELRENRLLYELGEKTQEEYEERNNALCHQRMTNKRLNIVRPSQRINILG
ncbi:MAG: gas vesicle protein GvpG [Candidatus Bathyarchaeia archaeon]